jgi:hypothetical protein
VGVRDALLGLRFGHRGRGVERRDRRDDEFATERREPVVDGAGRVVGTDRDGCASEHRAGVEPGFHLHDADAGLGIAREDRPVDGRCPTPARQEGPVDVDAPEREGFEDRLRQQESVGGDDHGPRAGGTEQVDGGGVLQGRGLRDGQAERERTLLHFARDEFHASPRGAVGLREDEGHFVPGCNQGIEGDRCKTRRAREDDAHGALPRFALEFPELRRDARLLEPGKVVHEYTALEVVHLVLQADGQEATCLEVEELAVGILGPAPNVLETRHAFVDTGDRETTLFERRFSGALEDFRIDEHHQLVVPVRDVGHEHAEMHIDLRRGESDARCVVHGVGHVGDQSLQ